MLEFTTESVGASISGARDGARDYLKTVAIVIEAAGTLDRAAELGLIGGRRSAVMLSGLRDVIPVSRGGTSVDPDAEEKWSSLLATALMDRGVDALEELRSLVQVLEQAELNAVPIVQGAVGGRLAKQLS